MPSNQGRDLTPVFDGIDADHLNDATACLWLEVRRHPSTSTCFCPTVEALAAVSRCRQELCPNWNGDGGFCLGEACDPEAAEGEHCPHCRGTIRTGREAQRTDRPPEVPARPRSATRGARDWARPRAVEDHPRTGHRPPASRSRPSRS